MTRDYAEQTYGYGEQTHDYGEQMSLMLDGRLGAEEWKELQAHLETCDACRAQWAAFQQVDRMLSNAAQAAPAPGFAARFSARLARQEAQRRARQRIVGAVGVFAAGTAALALILIPILVAAWNGIGDLVRVVSSVLNSGVLSAPALLSRWIELAARWLVTLGALGEAGRSTAAALSSSAGSILAAYVLMLVAVMAAWVMVVRGVSGRKNRITLPVLVWL